MNRYSIDEQCIPGCAIDPVVIYYGQLEKLRTTIELSEAQEDTDDRQWLIERYMEHAMFEVGRVNPRTLRLLDNVCGGKPTVTTVAQLIKLIDLATSDPEHWYGNTTNAMMLLPGFIVLANDRPLKMPKSTAYKDLTFKLLHTFVTTRRSHHSVTLSKGVAVELFTVLSTFCRKLGNTLYKCENESEWAQNSFDMIVNGLKFLMIVSLLMNADMPLITGEGTTYRNVLECHHKKAHSGWTTPVEFKNTLIRR